MLNFGPKINRFLLVSAVTQDRCLWAVDLSLLFVVKACDVAGLDPYLAGFSIDNRLPVLDARRYKQVRSRIPVEG